MVNWLTRKLTLDWRTIPRPERSGYLSLLLVYSALCLYGEANGNHLGSGFSFRCLWMPWECMKQEQVVDDKPEPQPIHVRVTPLVTYCPACKVAQHRKRCFITLEGLDSNGAVIAISGTYEYPLRECGPYFDNLEKRWFVPTIANPDHRSVRLRREIR